MKQSNDFIRNLYATVFPWIFTALMGIILWLVKDMQTDIKGMLQIIPVMRNEIDHLKDRSLVDRLRLHELLPLSKPEEQITYDTLIKK